MSTNEARIRSERAEGAGCLLLMAVPCAAIGIGYIYGAGAGWLSAAIMLVLFVLII